MEKRHQCKRKNDGKAIKIEQSPNQGFVPFLTLVLGFHTVEFAALSSPAEPQPKESVLPTLTRPRAAPGSASWAQAALQSTPWAEQIGQWSPWSKLSQ